MEKSIGQILREAREKQKLKLEDVHKKTRISMKYLLALEEDRASDFPGEAYFLGFLRTYAKFLGLNGEELVEKYRQTKISLSIEESARVEKTESPIISQLVVHYRWTGILLGLLIVLLVYFLSSRLSFKKKSGMPSPPVSVSIPQEKKLILEAKANTDSWLRVIADGNLLYEKILSSGTEKRWEAKEKFHLRVGYVPGIEMKLNGKSVDLITGSSGYIKTLVLP